MTDWQPIESAPKDGRDWRVSSRGDVTCGGIPRSQHYSTKGYRKVALGEKTVFVHRLVALAFVPNPAALPEVNHINGVKDDNRAENLEWCSRSHNMKHAYATGLHPGVSISGPDSPHFGRNGAKHHQSMPVRALFRDGSFKDYESQGLAAQDGFSPPKISLCITGKRKSHGGAVWLPLPQPPETQP